MAGKKQRKQLSWAPDLSLRQVRMFLSEDPPSQFRYGGQDHLQAKSSWLWHATEMGSDDSLPPGFETPPQTAKKSKIDVSQIPLIKWKSPPKLQLNPEWLVVAGGESEEVTIQNQRLRGVLEAIYPRPSSIPPDPAILSGVEAALYDDFDVPLIPITAAEDEDASEFTDSMVSIGTSSQMQSVDVPKSWPEEAAPGMLPPDFRFPTEPIRLNSAPPAQDFAHGERSAMGATPVAEPDVMAAASVAFTAIMRSNEAGSMVDPDLLIKIFSNPAFVETLTSEYGAPKQIPLPGAASSAPPPLSQIGITSLPPPPAPQPYPLTNVIHPPPVNPPAPPAIQLNTSNPLPKAPPMKDINYYKSLIQQHGADRQEASPVHNAMQFGNHNHRDYPKNLMAANGLDLPGMHGPKQRDTKPKISRPCIYFNSPRGCRHGANCSYQHDVAYPAHIEQQKNSKRTKLDSSVNGRL